jgi:Tfp pilus assembly protein PilX
MRQLSLRQDERGSALITALLATVVMLALGMALLAIVDTQAQQSGVERTRDRGFNLSESVLNSEAFVLGRSWPLSGASVCGAAGAGFGDTLGAPVTSTTPAATKLLRSTLNASYTDSAYAGGKWQVNICDDSSGSTVWNDTTGLAGPAYDANANNKVWVRAQSQVGGKTRTVVGLVQARTTNPLNSKYGLVAGNISEDLGSTTAAITNTAVVSSLTSGLLNTNPPVGADSAYPSPASGVTGLRCGLLDNVSLTKTCVTGAIGALSSVPLINTLVTQGRFEQFPTVTSTSANSIGQLRTQAKAAGGVYMGTAPGASTTAAAPSCGISGATANSVVFIEQVGTGDQYCTVNVGTTGVTYKALVIGSGRVIIRGSGAITTYNATPGSVNLFTGVIYALNLQTSDQTVTSPTRELVRVEQGARVKGAIHADGKNATVGLIAPDFDSNALINGLLCPGALCVLAPTVTGLLSTLGLSGTLNALINGTCVGVTLGSTCLGVSIPALGLNTVVGGITSQLSTYGSAVRSDVATINKLSVYGVSGVVGGTFRDLQQQ